jgi:3-deoxy-D-manno-octulosonic-acid transferase
LYGDWAKIIYFPIDFWWFVRRAWKKIRPNLILLTDSELWPELLHQAKQFSVPVGIINGRISDRSFCRNCRFPRFSRWLWGHISFVFASGNESAERIKRVVSDPNKVIGIGNLKCDREPLPVLEETERVHLLHELGISCIEEDQRQMLVLLGCSTWPGEEELLLQALIQLRKKDPHWALVLVPRHAERRAEIAGLCRSYGVSFHLRSNGKAFSLDNDVAIVDSTGELAQMIRGATVAFLGKTLSPNAGAQSPMDGIAAGIPLVAGPNYDNFRETIEALQLQGAIEICANAEAVKSTLLNLAVNGPQRTKMSSAATTYLLSQRNTAWQIYDYIQKYL